MVELIAATGLGVAKVGFDFYHGTPFTAGPDMLAYQLMAKGRKQHRPFHFRWLLPWLLPPGEKAWAWVSIVSAVLTFPVLYLLADAMGGHALRTVVLFGALPWTLMAVERPVNPDNTGMFLCILSAWLFAMGWWWFAVPVVLVAASVKETTPVFAALFAWSPLALVGLLVPLLRWVFFPPRPYPDDRDMDMDTPEYRAKHAWWAGWRSKRGHLRNTRLVVGEWGLLLPLALMNASLWLFAALVVAYGQLAVACDRARIFMWAAPVVAIAASTAPVPDVLWVIVLVYGYVHPWYSWY